MSNPVSLIAGLLGLVSLAVAALYWLVPAGALPAFFPGFEAGSDHIHVSHAFGALIVGLLLLAVAWFQRARRA
jgi:hypothetical protein